MSEPSNGNNSVILFAREGVTPGSAGAQWGDIPTVPVPHKLLILAGGGGVGDVDWIPNKLLGSDPNPRDQRVGREKASGEFGFYPGTKSAAWLNEFALGIRGTTTGAGPYVSPSKISNGRLPSMTVEESYDLEAGTLYKQTTGIRFDKVTINWSDAGFREFKASWLGKQVQYSDTSIGGSVVDWADGSDDPFDDMQMTKFEIDGADFMEAKGGSIDIDHHHFGDHFVAKGSGIRRSLPRLQATVGGKIDTFFEKRTLLDLSFAGSYVPLEVEWTNGVYVINYLLPRIRFKRADPKIVDGPADASFPFMASKDSVAETSILATTTTSITDAEMAA